MLLMVEKELEEGYATLLIDMENLIINTWKVKSKLRNHHI